MIGQEIYYTTHEFFLSERSLYLVTFNTAKGPEESYMEHWYVDYPVGTQKYTFCCGQTMLKHTLKADRFCLGVYECALGCFQFKQGQRRLLLSLLALTLINVQMNRLVKKIQTTLLFYK